MMAFCELYNTQFSVGQGGLHLGELYVDNLSEYKLYVYIYDCGAINTNNLHKQIDNLVTKLVQPELKIQSKPVKLSKIRIFLSHLHQDHVNGLIYLKEKFIENNIQLTDGKIELYLPHMEEIEKNIILCSYINDNNISFDDYKKLIANPNDFFNDYFKVIYVDAENGKNLKDNGDGTYLMSHYQNITLSPDNCWLLRMFYRKISIEKNQQIKKISKMNFNDITPDNVKIFQGNYKKFLGIKDINLSSLCLYFGMTNNKSKYSYIHTGDINLRNANIQNELKEHYKDYIYNISYVQIPHHGSKYNSTLDSLNELFPNNRQLFVTKQENPNGHQQPKLSDEYIDTKKVYQVTENNNSKYSTTHNCSFEMIESTNFYK